MNWEICSHCGLPIIGCVEFAWDGGALDGEPVHEGCVAGAIRREQRARHERRPVQTVIQEAKP